MGLSQKGRGSGLGEQRPGRENCTGSGPGGGSNETSHLASLQLTENKTTRRQSWYLEDQQVEQDVEGARGRGPRAGWSLSLCHDEGEVSHLLLAGIDELYPAAVDQLVVMHLSCRGK